MDGEDQYSTGESYYPEDLETSDVEIETGITESQEAIDDFVNKQKSANTNKKTATDIKTRMTNDRTESLPASELDHLLPKFFTNTRRKNWEENELATISSFQLSIQRYLTEEKYPFNLLKRNENSRSVIGAKRKSLVHEHGKGNKPQAVQAMNENEEDALFEGE